MIGALPWFVTRLTNVRVTDALPAGLATETGQNSVAFDAGALAPGESKEFAFNAKAARTGKFTNPAKVTSAEGVEASAEASVTVVKPVLSVACATPENREFRGASFTQFIGRNFEICWTVKNSGDAPSANTMLEVPLPSGMALKSASDGGAASGGKAVWNLGTIAPGASKKVCGTFSADVSNNYAFNATVAGGCADPASTTCAVFVQGVNAILVEVVDDPDPIQVGEETTYTIRVTNQGGGLDLQDVAIKALFPSEITPTVASNGGRVAGQTVTWPVVEALRLRDTMTYTVKGKAVAAGDARMQVEVTTKDLQNAIVELESTTTY